MIPLERTVKKDELEMNLILFQRTDFNTEPVPRRYCPAISVAEQLGFNQLTEQMT